MIFDVFDHAISQAFLTSHENGTVYVTLKGGDEFSLVTLDDKAPDWPVASGTRYGGDPVKFVIDDVLFVEPRSVDPRMVWPKPARTFDDPKPRRHRRYKAPQPAPETASGMAA